MKRLMYILLLLVILLVFPQVTYAAPLAQNDGGENTLTEALGTLAVYAAVIAALAAGTEVITDLLRPFFGLERQPQAMETFEQMKEWLPATLKEMGADPKAQAQLQSYLNQLDSTVKQVADLADKERIAQEIQKRVLGAIKSVGGVTKEQLDGELQKLKRDLMEKYKLQDGVLDEAINSAKEILEALQGGEQLEVVKVAASLDSFGNLLDAVEVQRSEVISRFRRWWRDLRDWKGLGLTRRVKSLPEWIRERSLVGVILYALEGGWNRLWGKGGAEESIKNLLTPENAAQVILDLDRKYHLTEARRQRLLRFIAAFIGMALAVVVRIDSLELLKPLFDPNKLPAALFDAKGDPYTLEQILVNLLGSGWVIRNWWGSVRWLFTWMEAATVGMLLSGLAASAGSSFWHDQLDRLRATKQAAEQVTAVVTQLRGSESEGGE